MSQFFADTHTILELDLSKRDVLHRLVPSVLSCACVFMIYHYIRDVRTVQTLCIIYSHSKEYLLEISKFFGDTHTILERDLSTRDVLYPLMPSVVSYACVFMRYR